MRGQSGPPGNERSMIGLDVNTLFLVTIYVEAMLGLLLLFAWVQNSGIHAVAWWGCAHLLQAGSVCLFGMYGTVSDAISIDLANALLFTAFAVTWTGARVFDGRMPQPLYIVGGAILWLLASRTPFFAESMDARVLLSSGIITAYTWATAYEFWRGRAEPLVSRWPAIFMLFAHGALFLLRTPLSQMLPWSPTMQVFDSVWLTVLSFEALLFTIAIAFILLAMAKERTELRHKTAALVDPLTGIANRRAFLEAAQELSEQQAEDPRPIAVLLGGMKVDVLMGIFPASLFLTLVGVTLLFGIAQQNGTLEALTRRYTAEIIDLLQAYARQRVRTIKRVHVVRKRTVWAIKDARRRLEHRGGRSTGDGVQRERAQQSGGDRHHDVCYSASTLTPHGLPPVWMRRSTVPVAASMTETSAEEPLAV